MKSVLAKLKKGKASVIPSAAAEMLASGDDGFQRMTSFLNFILIERGEYLLLETQV